METTQQRPEETSMECRIAGVLPHGHQAPLDVWERRELELRRAFAKFNFDELQGRYFDLFLELSLQAKRNDCRFPEQQWIAHLTRTIEGKVPEILKPLVDARVVESAGEGRFVINTDPIRWDQSKRRLRVENPRESDDKRRKRFLTEARLQFLEIWKREHLLLDPNAPTEARHMRRFRAAAHEWLVKAEKSLNEMLAAVDLGTSVPATGGFPDGRKDAINAPSDVIRGFGQDLPTSPGPAKGGPATATASEQQRNSGVEPGAGVGVGKTLPGPAVAVESSACVPEAAPECPARTPEVARPADGSQEVSLAGHLSDGVVKGPDSNGSGPFNVPDASKPDASKPDASKPEPVLTTQVEGAGSFIVPDDVPQDIRNALEQLAGSLAKSEVLGANTKKVVAPESAVTKKVSEPADRAVTKKVGADSTQTRAVPGTGSCKEVCTNRTSVGFPVPVPEGDRETDPDQQQLLYDLHEIFSGEFDMGGRIVSVPACPDEMEEGGRMWWALTKRARVIVREVLAEFRVLALEGYPYETPNKWITKKIRRRLGEKEWNRIYPYRERSIARKAAEQRGAQP